MLYVIFQKINWDIFGFPSTLSHYELSLDSHFVGFQNHFVEFQVFFCPRKKTTHNIVCHFFYSSVFGHVEILGYFWDVRVSVRVFIRVRVGVSVRFGSKVRVEVRVGVRVRFGVRGARWHQSLTCFLLLPVERIPKCLFFFLFVFALGHSFRRKPFFPQNLTPTQIPTLILTPILTFHREGFLGEAVAISSCKTRC